MHSISQTQAAVFGALQEDKVFVTRHALTRVQMLHPTIGFRGVLRLLTVAVPVTLVDLPFLRTPLSTSFYLVARQRNGVFVLVRRDDIDGGLRLATCIRVNPEEQRFLIERIGPSPEYQNDQPSNQ